MQFLDFVTKFYIRKIKDKHKIISQATTKKLVSNLSNISNYFGVWCATDFIALWLKTLINFTSAAFGSARNHMRMRLRKKFVIYSRFAILCCHLVCGCGETKSPCKFYKGKKSSKKGKREITKWSMERLFEKLGSVKFPKLPGASTRGVCSTPYELPAAKGQHADAHWVMTYGYKTQSFMKNGGQEKYLDKALNRNIYLWSSLVNVPCFF